MDMETLICIVIHGMLRTYERPIEHMFDKIILSSILILLEDGERIKQFQRLGGKSFRHPEELIREGRRRASLKYIDDFGALV
jgi:hypothetical protein